MAAHLEKYSREAAGERVPIAPALPICPRLFMRHLNKMIGADCFAMRSLWNHAFSIVFAIAAVTAAQYIVWILNGQP